MRYLGIDYGAKNVGLAISDQGGRMAFPFSVLHNDMSLLAKVYDICDKEKITAIVIGESIDMSGEKNKIMGSIEELKKNLETELDLPIYFEKEFMTSVYSGEQKFKNILQARKVKKGKEMKDDSKAATLILQRFLEKKNN